MFRARYLGAVAVGPHHTSRMVPWLVAREHPGDGQLVQLAMESRALCVLSPEELEPIFKVDLDSIVGIVSNLREPRCMALLLRDKTCHIFRLESEVKVREMEGILQRAVDGPDKFLTRQREGGDHFEVFYVGRIKTSADRPNGSFLDQAILRFRRLLDPTAADVPEAKTLLKRLSVDGAKLRRKLFQKSSSTDQTPPSPVDDRKSISRSLTSLPQAIANSLPSVTQELHAKIKRKLRAQLSFSPGTNGLERFRSFFGSGSTLSESESIEEDTFPPMGRSSPPLFIPLQTISAKNFRPRSRSLTLDPKLALSQSKYSQRRLSDIYSPNSKELTENGHSSLVDRGRRRSSLKQNGRTIHHPLLSSSPDCSSPEPLGFPGHDDDSDDSIKNFIQQRRSLKSQTSISDLSSQMERGQTSAPSSPYINGKEFDFNRTMLFVVGKHEIFLLSPDRKKPLLSKSFTEISHCTQGIRYPDHFGVICREVSFSGDESFVAYVFRCQTRDVVDEVMQTMQQAFQLAHRQYERQLTTGELSSAGESCDTCPLRWFHRLCQDIEGLPEDKAQLIIFHRMASMSISDQAWVINNTNKSDTIEEQNVQRMTLLLDLCERHQEEHKHVSSGDLSAWPNVLKAVIQKQSTVPLRNVLEKMSSSSEYKSWKQVFLERLSSTSPDIGEGRCKPPNVIHTRSQQRSSQALRGLWKKAILEQIAAAELEKHGGQEESVDKETDYYEYVPSASEEEWSRILQEPYDGPRVRQAVLTGIPRTMRGKAWIHMSWTTHQGRSYHDLLRGLTPHQHAILIDLGRTFPHHPYFSNALGSGQLALYNILKAYSLLDPDMGYCQGLSFVAGVLLLHMAEENAFQVFMHLMMGLGLRDQYMPDMKGLHIQVYQLQRLIQDRLPEVASHLEDIQVLPGMFASSWFLTIFAAEFPLGFSARVLDLVFLDGKEVLFRVAFLLLQHHCLEVLSMDLFETAMEFLKKGVTTSSSLSTVLTEAATLDLSGALNDYEIEYYKLGEPDLFSS